MKRLSIFFLALLLLTALQAQTKKVAMLEPLGNATGMQKAIVRAALAESITNSGGYEALTRTDVDELLKEFNFQEGGMVSDDQRQRLGRMSGAELLCIIRVFCEDGECLIDCSLIDIESGRIVKTANEIMSSTPASKIREGCMQLAVKLTGRHPDFVQFETLGFDVQTFDISMSASISDAHKLCQESNKGGYNNWRLPNIEELRAIYILRESIGNFSRGYYWSNTPAGGGWYRIIDFRDGQIMSDNERRNCVRCVRTR